MWKSVWCRNFWRQVFSWKTFHCRRKFQRKSGSHFLLLDISLKKKKNSSDLAKKTAKQRSEIFQVWLKWLLFTCVPVWCLFFSETSHFFAGNNFLMFQSRFKSKSGAHTPSRSVCKYLKTWLVKKCCKGSTFAWMCSMCFHCFIVHRPRCFDDTCLSLNCEFSWIFVQILQSLILSLRMKSHIVNFFIFVNSAWCK